MTSEAYKKYSNDYGREVWEKSGLTYQDLNESKIHALCHFLDVELAKHYFANSNKNVWIRVANIPKREIVMKERVFEKAFIKLNSNYFKGREAISFNGNGFIGFCGWGSSRISVYIVKAFVDWVDFIKNEWDEKDK